MRDDGDGAARWYWAWAAVGAFGTLALLAALTIGIFLVPVVLVAVVVLVRRPESFRGLPGLVSGLGAPLLYVAYLNRDGPGEVCTTSGGGVSCTEEWSPWPWLGLGVLLVVIGAALFLSSRAARRA
jgi:hypothetical protein